MTWERNGRRHFFKEASDAHYEKMAAGEGTRWSPLDTPAHRLSRAQTAPTQAAKDYQDYMRQNAPGFWDSALEGVAQSPFSAPVEFIQQHGSTIGPLAGATLGAMTAPVSIPAALAVGAGAGGLGAYMGTRQERAGKGLFGHAAPGQDVTGREVAQGAGIGALGGALGGAAPKLMSKALGRGALLAAAPLGFLGGMYTAGKLAPAAVADVAETAANKAPNIASQALKGLIGGFKGLGSTFTSDVAKPAWEGLGDFARGARHGLEDAYKKITQESRGEAPATPAAAPATPAAAPAPSKPSTPAVRHTQVQRPRVSRIKPTTTMAQFK